MKGKKDMESILGRDIEKTPTEELLVMHDVFFDGIKMILEEAGIKNHSLAELLEIERELTRRETG